MLNRDELVKMPMDQLERARDLITSVIGEKETAKLEAFRKEIESRAKKVGVDLSALLKTAKGNGKVAPKYRNPGNSTETWSGRGIAPRWFAALNKTAQEAARIDKAPVTPTEASTMTKAA